MKKGSVFVSELLYKTRASSTVRGKSKVYFCCHPDEFDKFFKQISDEILAVSNCSVWYNGDREGIKDEAFFADLLQMQMFVMPITTKLLTTHNDALEREFKFATENHIPVLPLMQEQGLEELFNKKCGDLQFLDKNLKDETAISYEEKFKKYLSSVLIGDELAEKIRNEFDGYIFLSYRKKDRKYAQKLMRLIHKNDTCRDIAIWYDEFLTPGENFNDSIHSALKKSGLFVLTVTPNIVNEINYIMTTEYPMAIEEGKDIFPVELVPTDRDELKEKYAYLPDCTEAEGDMFTENLLKAVEKIQNEENNNSPEHNYFIGLAYLSGVDLEVDYQKAVELITDSSEQGFLDAIDKLIEMYKKGHGVSRSYEDAVKWQKRKIEILKKEYEEGKTERKLNSLFWAICSCGDILKEFGKLKDAKEKYDDALQVVLNSDFADDDSQKRNSSIICNRLGDVLKLSDDINGAKEYYIKSVEADEILWQKNDTYQSRCDLYLSCLRMAKLLHQEGNLFEAREYCEKILELTKEFERENSTPEEKNYLIQCYEIIGEIAEAEGNIKKASYYYEKIFNISEPLAKETEDSDIYMSLNFYYYKKAELLKAEGKISQAKEYTEKLLNLSIDLEEKEKSIISRENLALSYEKMGIIVESEGKLDDARLIYEKVIEIREGIVRDTEAVDVLYALIKSYCDVAGILESQGNSVKAKEYYKKMLEKIEEIAKNKESMQVYQLVVEVYQNSGAAMMERGRFSQAKECFKASLEIVNRLWEQSDSIEVRRTMSLCYSNMGLIFMQEKNYSAALDHMMKSLEIARELTYISDSVSRKRDLATCYSRIGDLFKAQQKYDGAYEYYKKSVNIMEIIFKETEAADSRYDLCICYDRIGSMLKAKCESEKAKDYFEKMLQFAKEQVEIVRSVDCLDILAVAYTKMAATNKENEISYLNEALSIYESLLEKAPDISRYRNCVKVISDEIAMKTAMLEEGKETVKDEEKKGFLSKVKSFFGF